MLLSKKAFSPEQLQLVHLPANTNANLQLLHRSSHPPIANFIQAEALPSTVQTKDYSY
jgi:hypothetical protein